MAKFSKKPGAVKEPEPEPEAPKTISEEPVFVDENYNPISKAEAQDRIDKIIQGATELGPKPKMLKVVLAECGLLRDNELSRQLKAGIVKTYSHMMLEGVEFGPNQMIEVPETATVLKAIDDGWIIYVGR
jgi:hypothetical protein